MPLSDIKIGRRVYRMLSPEHVTLDRWTGGLDLRERVADMSPQFLLQARNLDQRGGRLRARAGYNVVAATPAFQWDHGYYSAVYDAVFLVSETNSKVYKVPDLYTSGTFTDVTGTLPNFLAGADLVDFNGKLVMVNTTGVYAFDGAAWTQQTVAVKGTMIAAWENKLFVAGDPGNKQRLWWSNAGSFATWTTATDFNDIRTGPDADAAITALFSTQNMDVLGRPALVAFKRRSLHAVNDPTTGSYTTLNAGIGCVGRRAVASTAGLVAFVGDSAIYATNGVAPAAEISGAIAPLFRFTNDQAAKSRVVAHEGRFVFSMPGWNPLALANSANGVVHVEYDPAERIWGNHTFGAHTDGVACWFTVPSGALSAGANNNRPRIWSADRSAPSKLFLMFDWNGGTTEGGGAATAFVQTPYLYLAGGTKFRVQRVRLSGLPINNSTFTLRARFDGSDTDSAVRTLSSGSATANVREQDAWQLGCGRSVSFVVEFPVGVASSSSLYRTDAQDRDTNELVKLTVDFVPVGMR